MADAMTRLIECDRVPVGGGVFVRCEDHELAVYHASDPDRFFVSDNSCPHAGGNLSGGEIRGATVSCPYHYWTFDLITGACVDSPRARVRVYRCKVRDGVVYADLGK